MNVKIVKMRRNYKVGPSNLSCVRNWFLKFIASTISPSSFKTVILVFLLIAVSSVTYKTNETMI